MSTKNIIPDINLQRSKEVVGYYNSRDFYKGTSFKMSGQWSKGVYYFNDEYVIDFVAYNGTLWACQHSHLSSDNNQPSIDSQYWTQVITGVEGKAYVPSVIDGQLIFSLEATPPTEPINIDTLRGPSGLDGRDGRDGRDGIDGRNGIDGINGVTYKPDPVLENGYIVFRANNGDIVKINFNQFKGDKGDKGDKGQAWIFSKALVNSINSNEQPRVQIIEDQPGNINTTYTIEFWLPKGNKGDKGNTGAQGKQGIPGPSSEFKIEFDFDLGQSILYHRLVTNPVSEWIRLGPVGGFPGKSPKLIKVLGTTENPDIQDDTRRNDRILWGYDGVPVSEWTTLCYLDDLRGDENIWVGCDEPKMPDGQTVDHDKIWYDPCDESIDQFSTVDFIYQSYLDSGGTLSKEDFILAFSSINSSSNLEIRFAKTFEDLGEPNKDKMNILWLVLSDLSGQNNQYTEYVVVYNQETDIYSWEQIGLQTIDVELKDYYTKEEVDTQISDVKDLIDSKGFITIDQVPMAGTIEPKAPDIANTGVSTKYAREDHVHPIQTSISGNAGTATKLETAQNIIISGDANGSGLFDGSQEVNITLEILDDSHKHGNDTITSIDASKITSGLIDLARLPDLSIYATKEELGDINAILDNINGEVI